MHYKYTENQIREAVKESRSYREVLSKLGASLTSGGVYQNIKKRLKQHNISISHFKPKGYFGGKATATNQKLHWSKILVNNRGIKREKRARLKRALLESGREYKCAKCGIISWNGKKLKLEIHHKNNDCLDNRKENLDFLCPNCHSQE